MYQTNKLLHNYSKNQNTDCVHWANLTYTQNQTQVRGTVGDAILNVLFKFKISIESI